MFFIRGTVAHRQGRAGPQQGHSPQGCWARVCFRALGEARVSSEARRPQCPGCEAREPPRWARDRLTPGLCDGQLAPECGLVGVMWT